MFGDQRSRFAITPLVPVGEIVEPQPFPVLEFKDDACARVTPTRPQALQLAGFDGERDFTNLRRMDRYHRIRASVVEYVHAYEDSRPVEAECRSLCLRVGLSKIERSETALRHTDLPLVGAPVNDSCRIFTFQQCPGGEVRIVKSDVLRRSIPIFSCNINFSCLIMTNAKDVA